jgi:hypothetical protein
MVNENTTNPTIEPTIVEVVKDPYFKKEFELYVLWQCQPAYFKRPPRGKDGTAPSSKDFLEGLGIDDDIIFELAEIKTQAQFAARYGLSPDTLTAWNKSIENRNILEDMRKWARRISKNVVLAMYNNALSSKNLNADRDRLNFLKFAGYVEKTGVELSTSETLTDILKNALIKKKNGDTNGTTAIGA